MQTKQAKQNADSALKLYQMISIAEVQYAAPDSKLNCSLHDRDIIENFCARYTQFYSFSNRIKIVRLLLYKWLAIVTEKYI